MRSQREILRPPALAALILAASAAVHAQSEGVALPLEPGQAPTAEHIQLAFEAVAADPNLATKQRVRTLRWREDADETRDRDWPSWLQWVPKLARWIAEFIAWLAESARVLLWIAAGLFAALLIIYIARVIRTRGLPALPERFVAPSHVRDLDIRPESLPEDIGAAARELWDNGEHRAALALLYRGLLSRLVHVHGVPIRDSSTEGDCLALSAPRLDEARQSYVSSVVRMWQRAVYGAESVATPAIHALCDGFSAALDGNPADPGRYA